MAAGGVVGTAPAGAVAPAAGARGEPPAALPPAARAYLGVLAAAAAVVLGGALFALAGSPPSGDAAGAAGAAGAAQGATLATGAVLVALAVLTQLVPVKVAPGHAVTLAAAVFYAAVLLCPPPAAVLVVGLGQLLGQATLAIRRLPGSGRRRRGPAAVVFNTAQAVLAAWAGATVYAALRPRPEQPARPPPVGARRRRSLRPRRPAPPAP